MSLGTVIGALRATLGMDSAEFEKGATSAERRANRLEKNFASMGKRMAGIGKTLSLSLTAPLTAFGVLSFNAASDAAELQSAFDQTFGAMAKDMNEWAVAQGDAMGRSTQSMQQLANTFGIFFNQAAPTRKEAAEMSKTFAVLAQDLASFYNVTEDDALAKLRSGLAGEAEPLRDFGVFLSAAAVEAKAMQMGLADASGEISEQAKIMARYQLILESTKNAQGDVARTSDGTANQIRAAKAAFEELQVTVGTKLLPVLTPLIEKLGKALEWFAGLPQPVQDTALVVGALSAALGPVLVAFGNLLPLLVKLGPVLGVVGKALLFIAANPAILAFAAVLAGIYLAWKHWDEIEPIIRNLYNAVKTWLMDKLGAAMDWVRKKVEMVEQSFAWLYDKVVGNSWIPDMVTRIGEEAARLQDVMVRPMTSANEKVEQSFADMTTGALDSIDTLLQGIKGGKVTDVVRGLLGALQSFGVIKAPASTTTPSGGGSWDFPGPPGFAKGGSFRFGGVPGVDRNLLSLNGTPIARVSRGEIADIRPANDRSGVTNIYYTLPSDEFWGQVDGRAGEAVARAGPSIARAGAQGAVARMRHMADRGLG